MKKALFIQRLVAFLLDMILVILISSIITSPFMDNDKIIKLEEETKQVLTDYQNEEIEMEDYLIQYSSLYYKLAKASGLTSIVSIFISVSYFVVFQVFNKGQTIGKKLMKIRVVSDKDELSYNQMIFRSFMANFILLDLIKFIFLLFTKASVFFYVSIVFEILQYLCVLISMLMILNKKNGLAIHDRIAHTMVLKED